MTDLNGGAVVIGGGNAAVDSARTALRLGARPVTILYRRTRDEMPAIREEIEDALFEGVDMQFLLSPLAVEGDGRVHGVRCAEMELGDADESGRRRPIPKPESERTIEADHVIVAIGQAPDLTFASQDDQLVVSRGLIAAHPVTQLSGDGSVFAGGDVVTGPATIVQAVAAGQRAAQAIDTHLGGTGELPPDRGFASPGKPEEPEGEVPRVPIEELPVEDRLGNFSEVLRCYSREAACAEARRCLRCDLEE